MNNIYLFGMAVAAALLLFGCAGGNAGTDTGADSGTSLGTGDVGLDTGNIPELPPLTDDDVGTASADEVAGALSVSDLGLESGEYSEPSITAGEAEMEPVEPF